MFGRTEVLKEKKAKVKCKKYRFASDHTTSTCKLKYCECKYCKDSSHHFLLCHKKDATTNSAKSTLRACATSFECT